MNYLEKTIVEPVEQDQILSVEEVLEHLSHLEHPGNWELIAEENSKQYIKRIFSFNDIESARSFMDQLKIIMSDIHTVPENFLKGTEVSVRCFTPHLNAVHINDIVAAAHVDDLYDHLNIDSSEQNKVDMASDDSFPASDSPGY